MIRLRSALLDVEHELQPEWLALPLWLRGAHRALLVLASYLADGGRIACCKGWSSAQWLAKVGFRPRYVLASLGAKGLVRWDGDDLVVVHYVLNHELRIRGLIAVRVPEMNAARAAYRSQRGGGGWGGPPAPRAHLGVGKDRVNCAKVLKAPPSVQKLCTEPLHRALTPDPPRRSTASADARPRAVDPDLTLRSDSFSVPPVPRKGSPARQRPGGSSGPARPPGSLASRLEHRDPVLMALPTDGPEGFERWVRAMPVLRRPRSAAVARRWRDENLAFWCRHDLEGEADEIVAELERRKRSFNWRKGFVPSPINFLRAASWRRRPKVTPPKVWGPAPEVWEPAPTWRPPESNRDELDQYVKSLVRS